MFLAELPFSAVGLCPLLNEISVYNKVCVCDYILYIIRIMYINIHHILYVYITLYTIYKTCTYIHDYILCHIVKMKSENENCFTFHFHYVTYNHIYV